MERDEWNMDNFAKLAMDATREVNGQQIFGFASITQDPGVIYFIRAFGGTTVKIENGCFVSAFEDENTIAALNFLRKMNVDDKSALMPPDMPMWDFGRNAFIDGKVAMCQTDITVMPPEIKNQMADDYGIVPIPKGPGQTEYMLQSQSLFTYVMPASIDPGLAAAIGDLLNDYHRPLVDEARAEELRIETWEQYVCDAQSIETLKLLYSLPNPIFPHFGFGDGYYNSIQPGYYNMLRGEETIAQALASRLPPFNADLLRMNNLLAP